MAQGNPYDAFIMDHIKNARNYRVLHDASHQATGSNILCGDEMSLYLKIVQDRIEDVAFQCTCCGISMASASIMTESIEHKSIAEAKAFVEMFSATLNGNGGRDGLNAGQRAILDTVRKFPGRVRCAALAWSTLLAAFDATPQAPLTD